jgi:hypothetical protein
MKVMRSLTTPNHLRQLTSRDSPSSRKPRDDPERHQTNKAFQDPDDVGDVGYVGLFGARQCQLR